MVTSEPVEPVAGQSNPDSGGEKIGLRRPKSKTAYPYFDLEAVLVVARQAYETGGGSLSGATLARLIRISLDSGPWKLRLSAGRLYGLLEEDNGVIKITERATRILAPHSEADKVQALAEAFRAVPLFRGLMEFLTEGRPIPPTDGLDDAIKNRFGIVDNKVKFARDILLRAARQAGVLEVREGRQYLVLPKVSTQAGLAAPAATPPLTASLGEAATPTSSTAVAGQVNPPVAAASLSPNASRATPEASKPIMQRNSVELRLTDEELAALEDEDIKNLYAAVGDFEAIRRKAIRRLQQKAAGSA